MGVVAGEGPLSVSLIAGNHADEPVGPETLRLLVEHLCRNDNGLLSSGMFTFAIVPHTNPDGEARNRSWQDRWPDLHAFVEGVSRERPGRDLEFGFPELRVENRNVSAFLKHHRPFALHMSLHGMAFSEGALLLVDREWAPYTSAIGTAYKRAAARRAVPLHDHNRKGEKGFFYLDAGSSTTPEGAAMRRYFDRLGDFEQAHLFHHSSMEFVQSLGGRPLCLVTEMPLFLVKQRMPHKPGDPVAYLEFKDALAEWRVRKGDRAALDALEGEYGVRPVSVQTAVAMQLTALAEALRLVARRRNWFVPQIET